MNALLSLSLSLALSKLVASVAHYFSYVRVALRVKMLPTLNHKAPALRSRRSPLALWNTFALTQAGHICNLQMQLVVVVIIMS